MKKVLIAALVSALPAAAMAEVVIYGSMRGALESTNTFGTGSENGINDYSSRIGFKGSEDLGNGLKAIWKVESELALDGGEGTTLGSRETYMGLASDFGTVRMGRINNTANDLGMLDIWEYGNGVDGLATFTRTGKRLGDSIRFDSANYYGFSASVGHSFAENDNTQQPIQNEGKGATYFGLNYENGPFAALYAAQMQEDAFVKSNGELSRGWQHRLEGTFTENNLFLGLGLSYVKGANAAWNTTTADSRDAQGLKSKEVALTAAYTFGNITPKITYAKGWDLKSDNSAADKALEDSGYTQWIVGADYALSKRTTAFTSYGVQNFGDAYKAAIVADGGNDTKIKTFSVGMRHDF